MLRLSLGTLGALVLAMAAGCSDDAVEPEGTTSSSSGGSSGAGGSSGSSSGAQTSSGSPSSSGGSSTSSGGSSTSSSSSGDVGDAGTVTLSIASPREGSVTYARKVRVTGTAVGATQLTWSVGGTPVSIEVAADGTFAADVIPAPGANAIVLVATGADGATTTETRTVRYGHRVSCGNSQAALVDQGVVYTWGRNELGQLGNGSFAGTYSAVEETNAALPGKYTPTIANDVVSIVTRQTFMLALHGDGTVSGWGSNESGQLGMASPSTDCGSQAATGCAKVPTTIPGIADAVAVEPGFDHSLVLRADGTVLSFGANAYGQLGDGTTTARATPAAVPGLEHVVQLAAGASYSLALDDAGHVWVWGSNKYGTRGDGTADGTTGVIPHATPAQVPGVADIVAIASSNDTPLALKADGTVLAWGRNNNGQAGTGISGDNVLAPTLVQTATGVTLANVQQVAADGLVSFAVTTEGHAFGWGLGSLGQLGQGALEDGSRDLVSRSFASPVAIPEGESFDVRELEVGAGGPAFAWTETGHVFGWGWSFQGSLGKKGLINAWAYSSPILVYPTP